jgi:UDP-glucose 4-epimerase
MRPFPVEHCAGGGQEQHYYLLFNVRSLRLSRQDTNQRGLSARPDKSQLFFEQALRSYDTAYGILYASLRYFNAAGADESGEVGECHEPEPHLISLALSAAAGFGPELQVFGTDYPTPDGTCVRD